MKIRRMTAALLALCLTLALCLPAQAAGTVQVTLPTFAVTLNGQTVDNAYDQYPLIVYEDITYVPMTFYGAHLLGLTLGYDNVSNQLWVDSRRAGWIPYQSYTTTQRNPETDTANYATATVVVDGVTIDNATEPYPLLVYRDVTYFPLTWRFCVDMFGWSYSFTEAEGLVITSAN